MHTNETTSLRLNAIRSVAILGLVIAISGCGNAQNGPGLVEAAGKGREDGLSKGLAGGQWPGRPSNELVHDPSAAHIAGRRRSPGH
ncbi:MAG: hypothetical protein ACKO85_11700, partial [Isosphaeraceae bacterium]